MSGLPESGRRFALSRCRKCADFVTEVRCKLFWSVIQRALIDAFVSASLAINDMSTRSMLGEPTDLERLSNAMSTLLRISRDLRISEAAGKESKTPTLEQYRTKVEHVDADQDQEEEVA